MVLFVEPWWRTAMLGASALIACSLVACERAPSAVVELSHDAALAPVVLARAPEPPGITEFDCTGTEPGQSTQSLRTWKSTGAAGSATNLKGHALACDVTLRSDCAGQAELRVSAGLARSEKVVTAVADGKPVSVKLRLASGLWEKALEPEDRAPYHETSQLVARAEVRCTTPASEPKPRYWTGSFIAGLMGERPRPAVPEPREPEVAVQDAPSAGEGEPDIRPQAAPAPSAPPNKAAPAATKAKATASDAAAATTGSERAAARAARRERRKNATPRVDLNLHPPKPASDEEEPASPDKGE